MQNMLLTAGGDSSGFITQIIMLGMIFVVFYFLLIRPQRKKEKQVAEMRSAIEVGDEIITIGGIIGRVVTIRDDNMVIETGSDRSKLRITKWAVQANNTAQERRAGGGGRLDKKDDEKPRKSSQIEDGPAPTDDTQRQGPEL